MPARDWLPAGGDAGTSAWPAELGTLPLLKVPEILSVIDGSEPPYRLPLLDVLDVLTLSIFEGLYMGGVCSMHMFFWCDFVSLSSLLSLLFKHLRKQFVRNIKLYVYRPVQGKLI